MREPKMSQKARPCNPFNVFSELCQKLCVCPAPLLSVCLSFPCSDACHVTLPFALDHQCQHYIPVWIWFVTWSSHFSTLDFAFSALARQRSNKVTSKTDDKEMSDVVKVRNQRLKQFTHVLLLAWLWGSLSLLFFKSCSPHIDLFYASWPWTCWKTPSRVKIFKTPLSVLACRWGKLSLTSECTLLSPLFAWGDISCWR